MEYQQFDLVYILSTKKVSWVSGPAGRPAKPQGLWSIVAFRSDGKIVLSKDETVIMTDITNIRKARTYSIDEVFKMLDKSNDFLKRDKNDGQREKRKN